MFTLNEAFQFLQANGVVADWEGNELFDCKTGNTICTIILGLVSKADINRYIGG